MPPGYVYRLPTEAEWEYACRAGTITRYSFGNDVAELRYYGWSGIGGSEGHHHPVGSLKPNPWGLFDMHGNVFEFVLDWYGSNPGERTHEGPPRHVIRGGSFYCPADVLRSACRSHTLSPGQPSNLTGFRVALGPDGPLRALLQASAPP